MQPRRCLLRCVASLSIRTDLMWLIAWKIKGLRFKCYMHTTSLRRAANTRLNALSIVIVSVAYSHATTLCVQSDCCIDHLTWIEQISFHWHAELDKNINHIADIVRILFSRSNQQMATRKSNENWSLSSSSRKTLECDMQRFCDLMG